MWLLIRMEKFQYENSPEKSVLIQYPYGVWERYDANERVVVSPTGCIVHASSSISSPSKSLGPAEALDRLWWSVSSLSAMLARFFVSSEIPSMVRCNIRSMCFDRSMSSVKSGLREASLVDVRDALCWICSRRRMECSPRNVGTELTRSRSWTSAFAWPLKVRAPPARDSAFTLLLQPAAFIAAVWDLMLDGLAI